MGRKHVNNPLDDDLSITSNSGKSGRSSYTASQENIHRTSWSGNESLDIPSRTRKTSDIYDQRRSDGPSYRTQNVQSDSKEVYVVRSITETDLSEYSWFRKFSEGIPLNCNNRYTLTLVNEAGAAHGTRGQNLNAVVFGKIEEANLQVQDRVQVKGKRRHGGRFEISKLYDYDAQEYIRINKGWKPVNGKKGGGGIVALAGIIIFILAVCMAAVSALYSYGSPSEELKRAMIIAVAAVLLIGYLVVTRFRILNVPWMQKLVIGIILAVILFYVPGGEQILAGVLIIWVLWKMLTGLFK